MSALRKTSLKGPPALRAISLHVGRLKYDSPWRFRIAHEERRAKAAHAAFTDAR